LENAKGFEELRPQGWGRPEPRKWIDHSRRIGFGRCKQNNAEHNRRPQPEQPWIWINIRDRMEKDLLFD
jgi:hypothetical protein